MSVIESPSNPSVEAEVDQTFSALRVTLRPHDFKGPNGTHIGGHYRTVITSGATTGIAANGILLSIRWANADRAFLLNRLKVWSTLGTAFAAAQENSVDLCRVVNMVNPDTGGTAITLGDSGRKSKTTMLASQITDVRVATAAACAAGALSTEEFSMCGGPMFGMSNVVGTMGYLTLFDVAVGHEGPIVVMRNEGLRVHNRVLQGAAGVIVYSFEMEWSEVPTAFLGI
jgi:hypothetical protein